MRFKATLDADADTILIVIVIVLRHTATGAPCTRSTYQSRGGMIPALRRGERTRGPTGRAYRPAMTAEQLGIGPCPDSGSRSMPSTAVIRCSSFHVAVAAGEAVVVTGVRTIARRCCPPRRSSAMIPPTPADFGRPGDAVRLGHRLRSRSRIRSRCSEASGMENSRSLVPGFYDLEEAGRGRPRSLRARCARPGGTGRAPGGTAPRRYSTAVNTL